MSGSSTVYGLLSKYAERSDMDHYTHSLCTKQRGYWSVDNQHYGEFYRNYCRVVNDNLEDNFGVYERSSKVIPLIVELTMLFDGSVGNNEYYDSAFLDSVTYHIQQNMLEKLQVEEDSPELTCIVLESEPVESEDGQSNEVKIRFQFPYCRVDVNTQRAMIEVLIVRLRSNNVAATLFQQPINDWDRQINRQVFTHQVLMYGSVDRIDGPLMKFLKVVGHISQDELESCEVEEDTDLSLCYNPWEHSYVNQGIVSIDTFSDPQDRYYWLPLFLSVNFCHKIILPKDTNNRATTTIDESYKNRISNFGKLKCSKTTALSMCHTFIKMWKPSRILEYTYCNDIGEAIYDADRGGADGLNDWINIIENSCKSEGKVPSFLKDGIASYCENKYYIFRDNRVTIRTLAWQAKIDNPGAYNAWHFDWCRNAMESAAMDPTHTDVARALYRVYWLTFFCSYQKGGKIIWYMFDKHRLKENPQGYKLRSLISGDFAERFMKMRTEISIEVQRTTNENDRRDGEVIITKIGHMIRSLKTTGFKSNIMTEAAEMFAHDEVSMYIGDNPELLGVSNGVIVATDTEVYFRPGRPEDYIVKNTNIPYNSKYHWDHPLVIKVIKWLRQVFVDDVLFCHFMKFMSSLLRGGNNDKKFPAWAGVGNNSKTMVVKLVECTMGSYCVKIPVTMASGGRGGAENASPAASRTCDTRVCFMDEPEEEDDFKGGLLKHLTGSDNFFARKLHENGGEIKPYFKLILVCNKPPRIPSGGKAMKNRFCIFPFLSTWIDNAPEDEAEQFARRLFKIDLFFEKYIPTMAPAMLWVMVQYYPTYIREGIRKTPDIVKEVTTKYWEDNDIYYQFAAENVEIATTPDGKQDLASRIDTYEIYDTFKSWYRNSFPGSKLPDKPKVITELGLRWSKPINDCWCGIKFKERTIISAPSAAGGGGTTRGLF